MYFFWHLSVILGEAKYLEMGNLYEYRGLTEEETQKKRSNLTSHDFGSLKQRTLILDSISGILSDFKLQILSS